MTTGKFYFQKNIKTTIDSANIFVNLSIHELSQIGDCRSMSLQYFTVSSQPNIHVFCLCPSRRRKATQLLDVTWCTHCLSRKQLYLPWLKEKSFGLFSSTFYFYNFNKCVPPLNCNLFFKYLCQFHIQVWKHLHTEYTLWDVDPNIFLSHLKHFLDLQS